MGLEDIVVKDYSVDISPKNGADPGDWGDFTAIYEEFSSKVRADGKDLLKGPTVVKLASGCKLSGYNFITGVGAINDNTEKTRCEYLSHFKKGATGSCNGIFVMPGPPPVTFVCMCDLEIDDANQDKARAN